MVTTSIVWLIVCSCMGRKLARRKFSLRSMISSCSRTRSLRAIYLAKEFAFGIIFSKSLQDYVNKNRVYIKQKNNKNKESYEWKTKKVFLLDTRHIYMCIHIYTCTCIQRVYKYILIQLAWYDREEIRLYQWYSHVFNSHKLTRISSFTKWPTFFCQVLKTWSFAPV